MSFVHLFLTSSSRALIIHQPSQRTSKMCRSLNATKAAEQEMAWRLLWEPPGTWLARVQWSISSPEMVQAKGQGRNPMTRNTGHRIDQNIPEVYKNWWKQQPIPQSLSSTLSLPLEFCRPKASLQRSNAFWESVYSSAKIPRGMERSRHFFMRLPFAKSGRGCKGL